MNPRWLAYCRFENTSLEKEKITWPGACMCGFGLFISEMKQRYVIEYPEMVTGCQSIRDQEHFTGFIDNFVNSQSIAIHK